MRIEFWSFEAVGFETLATGESLFNLQRASLHWRSRACTTFCPQPGKRPEAGARPDFNRSEGQAAALIGSTLQDLAGPRDRDRPRFHGLRDLTHEVDVQEPVLHLAPLTTTWSASWKLRSKVRSAMPL